jgi:poly-gamma-glutamate synthesis protein (capsule biosynthesis protein)
MRALVFIASLGWLGCASSAPSPPLELRLSAAARVSLPPASEPPAPSRDEDRADLLVISALGDCALGDLHHGSGAPGSMSAVLAGVEDPMAYPFSGVAELLESDDLTVANLEGVLTSRGQWHNEVFSIRGEPGWAAMLTRGGVEVVSLANNHSHDYGESGHADTKAALDAAGVGHFGRGAIDRRRVKGMLVVNLGYLGGPAGTEERMRREVSREVGPDRLVIVSFHWGVEGYYATHPEQLRLGRAAIDAGADLVLGHHPHVLQGIERYRDRHIVYSLGNFVFGANSKPEDMDSIIYQERFRLKDGRVAGVEQRIVPVVISSAPAVNDFRPMLLEGAEEERVRQKVASLSAALPSSR